MLLVDEEFDAQPDSALDWLQSAVGEVLATGRRRLSASEAETLAEPRTPTAASLAAAEDDS